MARITEKFHYLSYILHSGCPARRGNSDQRFRWVPSHMENEMKFHLFAAMVAASALSLASAANGQTSTNSSNPPPPSCTGNQCPGSQTFTVGGTSLFGGFGGSKFEGKTGYNLVEKSGSGGVDIKLSAGGGLCGVNCADGAFEFKGYAREHVKVQTGAFGDQSGMAVTATNQGGAQAAVNFQVNKLTKP